MFSTTLKRVRPSLLCALQIKGKPYTPAESFHTSLCWVRQPRKISWWPHRFQHRILNVTFLSTACGEKCWNCNHSPGNDFFCANCHAVQRISPDRNFFSLFGLEQQFHIDKKHLKTTFRNLQKGLHPDKFFLASSEEKQISAEMSSLVNTAFRTLRDPLKRGVYMLKLRGAKIPEDNTSSDKELLIEIMELNEELESMNNIAEIAQFETRIKQVLSGLNMQLVDTFKEENIDGAKEILSKMKYIRTLLGKVRTKQAVLSFAEVEGKFRR